MMIDLQHRKKMLMNNAGYHFFLFWVIVLSMVNGFLLLMPLPATTQEVLIILDSLICLFLLVDFLYRVKQASNRRHYFVAGLGWMDLVGSAPIPFAALLRTVPLVLAYRQLSRSEITLAVRKASGKRAQSTLLAFLLAAIVIFELSGMLVLAFEAGARDATITTGGDALWWAYVTVMTVGYGDMVPVTAGGRITGVFLMTVGIGLFSVITSFTADWFRSPRRRRVLGGAEFLEKDEAAAVSRVVHLRNMMIEHEKQHNESMAAMRKQLEQLEAML